MKSIGSILGTNKEKGTYAEITGDTLRIDCRGCTQVPEIRSPICVKCMVRCISDFGNAEKIMLRTSKDTEISGSAVEILCDMAFFDRTSNGVSNKTVSRSCNSCDHSCNRILSLAWEGFPDPYFSAAREKLMKFRPGDRDCELCLQKTYRALDQAELGLSNVKKKLSDEVAKTGGI